MRLRPSAAPCSSPATTSVPIEPSLPDCAWTAATESASNAVVISTKRSCLIFDRSPCLRLHAEATVHSTGLRASWEPRVGPLDLLSTQPDAARQVGTIGQEVSASLLGANPAPDICADPAMETSRIEPSVFDTHAMPVPWRRRPDGL